MSLLAAPATSVGSILVCDDEVGVRDLIVRWLERAGHRLSAASGADEALALLSTCAVDVAVLDLRMPGRDGLWLAAQIRRRSPETAIVMATGVRDESSAVSSLRAGVVDYLVKPFSRDQLHDAVQRALDWHRQAVDDRERAEAIAAESRARHAALRQRLEHDSPSSLASLDALLVDVTAHQPAWIAHARRVAELSAALSNALHVPPEQLDLLQRAALVHRIGRLTLPESVWMKAGPLTQREQIAMRELPPLAADLLQRAPYLAPAAPLVRARHEHVDGSGYPDGLRGDAIPLASRILAVADTYDTLVKPQWGRQPLAPSEAFEEIRRGAGTQFDPGVVRALRWILNAG